MNKSLLVSALLAVAVSGCGSSPDDEARRQAAWDRHYQEQASKYKITLIGADGTDIRSWTSNDFAEVSHGTAYFHDSVTGKKIRISGTFVVEQL